MMEIKYDLSVVEILKLLDPTTPAAQAEMEAFEHNSGIKLPTRLFEFLSFATNAPLFETADVWTIYKPSFFYDDIQERIDEDEAYYKEHPETYNAEEDVYAQFSQLPRERWPELVSNYLQVGSDFGAGVVVFGIPSSELAAEDPPVYYQHEANDPTEWEFLCDKLTDYLKNCTCDVLLCYNYHTAQKVLEKMGWHWQKYSNSDEVAALLSAWDVKLSAENRYVSEYGSDANVYCCYDQAQNKLFVVRENGGSLEMCVISK